MRSHRHRAREQPNQRFGREADADPERVALIPGFLVLRAVPIVPVAVMIVVVTILAAHVALVAVTIIIIVAIIAMVVTVA